MIQNINRLSQKHDEFFMVILSYSIATEFSRENWSHYQQRTQTTRSARKPFRPEVRFRFARIIFYMGYGKAITEGIDDFTQLFSHFMRETFRDHPIAGAVQVYLTD